MNRFARDMGWTVYVISSIGAMVTSMGALFEGPSRTVFTLALWIERRTGVMRAEESD